MCDDKPAMHIQIIQETEVLDQSPKEEDHHEATGQQKIAPCHRLVLENGQIQIQRGVQVLANSRDLWDFFMDKLDE